MTDSSGVLALPAPAAPNALLPHGKNGVAITSEAVSITPPRPLTPTDDRSTQGLPELLVVSPYTTKSHLLDLSTVSRPNQLLAHALTAMEVIRTDYATALYEEAFNWPNVILKLRTLLQEDSSYKWEKQSFYIVVFRSQIPPSTDRSHLGALDEAAHEEATASGGLLKYWFGTPDSAGRNLATCESHPASGSGSIL